MVAFYCDENVDVVVAVLLNQSGYSARTTGGERRLGAWDPDQLLYSTDQECVFVTHNRRDFRTLHDAWVQWSPYWHERRLHSGVLILDQGPPPLVVTVAIQSLLKTLPRSLAGRTYDWFARSGGVWEQWRL